MLGYISGHAHILLYTYSPPYMPIEIAEADKRAEREIARFERERAERLCSPQCFYISNNRVFLYTTYTCIHI